MVKEVQNDLVLSQSAFIHYSLFFAFAAGRMEVLVALTALILGVLFILIITTLLHRRGIVCAASSDHLELTGDNG